MNGLASKQKSDPTASIQNTFPFPFPLFVTLHTQWRRRRRRWRGFTRKSSWNNLHSGGGRWGGANTHTRLVIIGLFSKGGEATANIDPQRPLLSSAAPLRTLSACLWGRRPLLLWGKRLNKEARLRSHQSGGRWFFHLQLFAIFFLLKMSKVVYGFINSSTQIKKSFFKESKFCFLDY